MIQNVNNLLHHELHHSHYNYNLSSDMYPEQDTDYVGKLIQLSFRDEKDPYYETRFYEDYIGWRRNFNAPWFLILRCDKNRPYRVIAMDHIGRIIVTTKNHIDELYRPPVDESTLFEEKLEAGNSICTKLKKYPFLWERKIASTNEMFGKIMEDEKVHMHPIQLSDIIYLPVFTEYQQDIIHLNYDDTAIHTEYEEISDDEMRKELLLVNKNYHNLPNFILRGFHYYYNRFAKDKISDTKRVVNTGMILRADVNSSEPYIVVMEYRKDGLAFVCQDEANFYYDSSYNSERVNVLSIIDMIRGTNLSGTNITL